MNFTPSQLALVCAATLQDAAKYVAHLNLAMEHFEINTKDRVSMFLAQISFESLRLSRTEENLHYSAKRLMAVWPRRFPTLASTNGYAMNPEALAEKVYGMRKDLGNDKPGDGWLYRGRGLKQLTGKANYMAAEDGLGMLLTDGNAKRAAEPEAAAWTAAWFWFGHSLNALADGRDYERITRIINGGLTGYEDGNDEGMDDRVEYLEYTDAKLAEVWA